MNTLLEVIKKIVSDAIESKFQIDIEADISQCEKESFGHYQCNSSFKLGKILKRSPQEVARDICQSIDKEIFSLVEVAPSGFINFTIDSKYLSNDLNKIYKDPYLGVFPIGKTEKVIVEFSSPNIAKELHVGHLRSTIIGDCLARLFEFLNCDVLRLNHIGDWGTQFGMLIAYIKEFQKETFLKKPDLASLMDWYKLSKKKFDEDPSFKKMAHEEVVKLQNGDEDAFKAWELICDISRIAYREIYGLLDVSLEERGESYYNKVLKSVVEDLEKKELVEDSNGAKCIFLEGFKNRDGDPLPLIVQKSDGGFNYVTTDLAAMKNRAIDEKADRIIVVIDSGQSLHMKMIYEASVLAKNIDPNKTKFDHVAFGVVLGPDGKKFKTREGETEKLIDLLHGAIEKAKKILLDRDPLMNDKELEKISHVLGINAVKYSDLSCHRLRDYKFSYDRMLKFEGNTSTFLLYSYVRVMGIKRKIKGSVENILKEGVIELDHPSEISLGLCLRRFSETILAMEKDLLPNRLCDYLFSLAEKFNGFFRDCKVVGNKKEKSRLILCELTALVMKKGLYILGISTLDKM